MLLPTTKDSNHLAKYHKSHDEVNTYSHLIRHLSTDKDARKLTILLIINLVCAVLEVIYGLISNSIGLLSDSAHMLFDSTALAVGIYASYKATLPANSKFSYGFDRFQTLSGLINGIFLIFIGFYIFIESLERIYNPPVIHSSKMIVVAIVGLIVNVVGVTFFHEHAHFGDDHDHGHCHSHGNKDKKQVKSHQHSHKSSAKDHSHGHSHHHHDHADNVASIHHIESSGSVPSTLNSIKEEDGHHHHHAGCNHGHSNQQPDHHHQHNCAHDEKDHHHAHAHSHEHKHDHKHDHSHHEHEEHDHDHDHEHEHDHDHDDHGHHHHHNENLYGVFLHILADLLGSVGVITSSILIMLFDWYIADAICSAITSLLILASVVPLIKSSIMVFLQTYPAKYKKNFHQALSEISHHPSVVEFRDAHLWMYTQSKLVCSVVLVVKQSTTDTTSIVEFARKKLKSIKSIQYMTIDCRVEGQI